MWWPTKCPRSSTDGVYAAPAFLGAAATTLALELDAFYAVTAVAVAAVVFTIRLLA